MSKSLIACGGVLLALSLQGGAIVYDSTGQAPAGSDPIDSFGPLFDSFSTGANSGALNSLALVLNGDSTSGESFSVGLYADNSATPGALITTLGTVNDSSLTGSLSLINVVLTTEPILSTGTMYWIGASGETTALWSWTTDTSGTGVDGQFFSNMSGTFPNNPDGGYQMQVEIGGSSVPEPSTLFLGACSFVVMALFLARRRKLKLR